MFDDGFILHSWLRDLFPLSRSVVGPGIDISLKYLENLMTAPTRVLTYPSGTNVNGWVVPEAWELTSAVIKDLAGKEIVSTDNNNLHLWSHSIPFCGEITRLELEDHLLHLPEIPEAIPYATTYYKKNWGFSVNRDTYNSLKDEKYLINIETKLFPGSLKILEVVIPGESKSEILFSTYLCHPSMANNELSGPVLATSLIRRLSQQSNRYTYRFIFGPETIGPICYLSNNADELKNKVFAAFNLTCVGAGDDWSLLQTPTASSLADKIAVHILKSNNKIFRTYDFLERGSDERQFCSPNVNLPMVSIMRSKYNEFKEYHNSLDDCDFVTPARLQETLDLYSTLIDLLESEGNLTSKLVGEPFLTKFFNYPSIGAGTKFDSSEDYKLAYQLVAFSTGVSFTEIANRIGVSATRLIPILDKCIEFELIRRDFHVVN